uniref:carcinine hydrolase/isopenicillin-N N-acyltransferase family protein n=1 Tax=uncultured Allobacillus sp. TaxID=1638025 RepID=UPI0025995F97|nr:carcinine hydrolase/isopenicillin-N N-acyltransferase family protein [uncultured Allobacillus sp.]
MPHRHLFSYVLLDRKDESYVVEASPREVVAWQSNMCTNHFHLLDKENRYRQVFNKEMRKHRNRSCASPHLQLNRIVFRYI